MTACFGNWLGGRCFRNKGKAIFMKRINMAIILLLGALCVFLALDSFGIFRYGGGAQDNGFSASAGERDSAVNRGSVWRIAVLGTYSDQSYISEVAQGIGRIALMLNMEGGILGRPLEITYAEPGDDSYATRLATQKLCEQMDIAYLIGPVSSSRLREVRTLCQYYALPALAPFSPLSPELPVLEPDLYGVLYPTHLLFDPLIQRLRKMNCRNLLFISRGTDSYSSVFTNLLTENLRKDPFFHEIHRIDFLPPANESHFLQPLKRLYENSEIDAILFTDTPETLQVFGRAMRELNIDLPVFGNDLLAVSTLPHYIRECRFPLSYVTFQGNILPEKIAKRYEALFHRSPGIKEQLGIMGCLLFRDALAELKTYEAVAVGKKIKELSAHYFSDGRHPIELVIREVNPLGKGVDSDEK